MIAFVFTEVLSLTSASLILIVPVVESIVNGAPASSSHPVAFLVAVYVTSTGVLPSCFVYVTVILLTLSWFPFVTSTSPLSFGVTVGAVGCTLNVTSLSILSGA